MPFTSFRFFFFLAAVIFVYYIVPKKFQWAVLLAASYAFYLYSGVDTVFYMVGTTLFTYLSALLMQSMRNKNQKKILSSKQNKNRKRTPNRSRKKSLLPF